MANDSVGKRILTSLRSIWTFLDPYVIAGAILVTMCFYFVSTHWPSGELYKMPILGWILALIPSALILHHLIYLRFIKR